MFSFAFLKNDFFVDAGTLVEGNVVAKKNASVAGTINGDLHSTGTVIIQKRGLINGHVHARTAIIKGLVKGDIYCEEKIYVQPNASVEGNIVAAEAVIDKDSFISGTISKLAVDEQRKQEITEPAPDAESAPEISQPATTEEKLNSSEEKISSEAPPSNWF